jgi:hypothetical protein
MTDMEDNASVVAESRKIQIKKDANVTYSKACIFVRMFMPCLLLRLSHLVELTAQEFFHLWSNVVAMHALCVVLWKSCDWEYVAAVQQALSDEHPTTMTAPWTTGKWFPHFLL